VELNIKAKKLLYRECGYDGCRDKIGEEIHGIGQRSTCK
jgi:hypothetical protein